MRVPKLSLSFSESHSFLEECIRQFLAFGCKKVGVVVNAEGASRIKEKKGIFPPQMIIILNPYPEKGRFFSIKTGIAGLQHEGPLFIHNVDNPFIKQETLETLAGAYPENHVVCPEYLGKGGHPVLISEKISRDLLNEKKLNLKLKDFLQNYAPLKVEVNHPEVVVNINTPEEYRRWFS